MCRSTDNHGLYYQYQRDQLKIKACHLRLSITSVRKSLPESLTLHYLPRISGAPLEINGCKIRPDSDAFVTLHRVRSAEKNTKEAVFASRERVRAGEAVRFEVYLREEKVLKGIFRKDEEEEWKLECECVLERGGNKCLGIEISTAEVSVVAEGQVALIENVDMRRRKKCRTGFKGLDEIPEESVEGFSDDESDGCDCCCGETENGSDVEDVREIEMEMEGVRWAVDVGILVICLGVGFLVSKASSKGLRRRIF